MTGGGSDARLARAAASLGLATSFVDAVGVRQSASPESLRAVAAAVAGAPGATAAEVVDLADRRAAEAAARVVAPVVVAWQPGPVRVAVSPPPGARTMTVAVVPDGGTGVVWDAPVPADATVDLDALGIGAGRHHIDVAFDGPNARADTATVFVAPRVLPALGGQPQWGVFAPVWSAWTRRRPEVHLNQLDAVAAWVQPHGATLVGTLPMLATFLDQPADPSPYSPVTRRWWNEAVVDLDACVGMASCGEARRLRAAVAPADPSQPWDPVAHWARVRPVLAALSAHVDAHPALRAGLDAFIADRPEVVRYASFRAMVERTGTGWHNWPVPGRLDVAGDDPGVRLWAYAQWQVSTQLVALSQRLAGRGQQLYLDLALGSGGDGYDTWVSPGLFGWGAAVGAPPDAFFTGGQNWGFPPVVPDAARADGHGYLAGCLAAHFEVCGVLRLDHVMGLQRVFWVPDGASPADGVYVAQPFEELLAVLAVEADRAGASVIGENLGTVDPSMTAAMVDHGLYGMYVGQFEVPSDDDGALRRPDATVLASLNTHDTPSFAGWLAADDVDRRLAAGLLDDRGADEARRERGRQVGRLAAGLVAAGRLDPSVVPGWRDLLAGFVADLAASDAAAVLVSVDDLVGATEPQNVPGTPADRPNWVLRLPVPVDDLADDPWVDGVLAAVAAARRAR